MGSTAPGPTQGSGTRTPGYESSAVPGLPAHLLPALGTQRRSGTGRRAPPPRVSLPRGWDSRRAPWGAALPAEGFSRSSCGRVSVGGQQSTGTALFPLQPGGIPDSLSVTPSPTAAAGPPVRRAAEPGGLFLLSATAEGFPAACRLRLPPRARAGGTHL